MANDVLLAEYERYAKAFDAENFLEFLRLGVITVNPSDEEIKVCMQYFPENEVADAVHAATCLKTNAILIKVWNISEAISRIL